MSTIMDSMSERKNGTNGKNEPVAVAPRKVSKLGQRLREISDRALASGTETLSIDQIRALISQTRGSST